jgi:hypothetical protein
MTQDTNVCQHVWDFKIINMEDSNMFVEICDKCSENINTLELFKD